MTQNRRRHTPLPVLTPLDPAGPLVSARDATGAFPLSRVRCECGACGVHTIVTVCVTVGGCCRNCGSYDLRPLGGIGSDR